MSADRTLRFVVSGEHAFGPIARWRDADLEQYVDYAQWTDPVGFGALSSRLGLPQ